MSRDLGWFVTVSSVGTIGVIGWAGTKTEFASTTILWLIFGAIVTVGLAGLRGQATGIGRVIDDLDHIKSQLEDLERSNL